MNLLSQASESAYTHITFAEFSNVQWKQLQWNDWQDALQAVDLLGNLNRLIGMHPCLHITSVTDHYRISLQLQTGHLLIYVT